MTSIADHLDMANEFVNSHNGTDVLAGQVHATLALAEEQRTANLIALLDLAIRTAQTGAAKVENADDLAQTILSRLDLVAEVTP